MEDRRFHASGPLARSSNATTSSFFTQEEIKFPSLQSNFMGSCRNVEEFSRGPRLGEGTYGIVYRVQDSKEDPPLEYAIKRIRMENENDGFPVPSIREVNLLRLLNHKNIVRIKEVVVGDTLDRTFMLMEFCNRDLASLLDRLPEPLEPIQGGRTHSLSILLASFGAANCFSYVFLKILNLIKFKFFMSCLQSNVSWHNF
jgi:cyclin-dependent kinase 10